MRARAAQVADQHYLQMASQPGISPLQKTAYEQLAKLQAVDSTEWPQTESTWPLLSQFIIEAQDRTKPISILSKMGVDVLPVLVEALGDNTPTKTIQGPYGGHSGYPPQAVLNQAADVPRQHQGVGRAEDVKVWKVNELVALLICRIADRDFVVGEGVNEWHLSQIDARPDLAPQFKKVVLDWYADGKKTMAELKLGDLNGDDIANRVLAIKWFGEHKEKAGQKQIWDRVDALFGHDPIRSVDVWELSACALTLGQLGDPGSVPRVRRVCNLVVARYRDYPKIEDHYQLFNVYKGLALLGHKEEAIKELKELYKTCSGRLHWDITERKDFQKKLEEASHW